ncbi:hypothetical protein EBA29_00254 [Bacillus velezensis]|uniref:Uncharacterized protein n=1 Tax=Bacillus amyloliquefaciens (strain Y2) TaxID=1155777 RepID=I2C0Z6_BACAY|nr:hypothetical protein MUS_0238 [Bacillus velezensis YAU B9601-Y2]QAR55325.1 hypothetical protein EBA29_00254 [Bacillus velezensis]RUS02229.1 hypothetical protein EFW58_04212 [Bacillus velezensis]
MRKANTFPKQKVFGQRPEHLFSAGSLTKRKASITLFIYFQ